MRRTIRYMFLIVLIAISSSVFCGCKSNNEIAYAVNANFTYNRIETRVGDILNLEHNPFLIFPEEIEFTCVFSSSNPQIASVNALTGEIECLQEGTCIIFGRVKKQDGTYVGDSFEITVLEKLIYATNFFINTSEIVIGLDDENIKNEITLVGNDVNVLPTISYETANIIYYDKNTGKITPLAVGETTVYVTLQLQNEIITKSFNVIVVEKLMYFDMETNYTIQQNEFLLLTWNICDNRRENNLATSQTVTYEIIQNEEFIQIIENDYNHILLKTKEHIGIVIIKLISTENYEVIKNIYINII